MKIIIRQFFKRINKSLLFFQLKKLKHIYEENKWFYLKNSPIIIIILHDIYILNFGFFFVCISFFRIIAVVNILDFVLSKLLFDDNFMFNMHLH